MIGIIGGGISGLALAWYLQQQGKDYVLFESSDKAGGKIRTHKINGLILEEGPNSILCDEACIEFLEATGCMKYAASPNPVSNARFIWKQGKYRKLPSGPGSLFIGSFFSLGTKARILGELMRKPSKEINEHESVAGFFERHFGREVVDYAVQPFISGIYAGNADKLSLDLAFPRLREFEQAYGSVLKGLMRTGGKRKQSLNFQDGMQSMPQTIAASLTSIHFDSKVEEISQVDGGYLLEVRQLGELKNFHVDKIVLAIPATDASLLLHNLFPLFAFSLSQVPYASVAVVHSIINEKNKIKNRLSGFGGLHPAVSQMATAGSIWSDLVFTNRCEPNQALFTSFISSATQPALAQWNGTEIRSQAWGDLRKAFQLPKAEPDFQHHFYWHEAIPQYESRLKAIWDSAEELKSENMFFLANWLHGVSLADCIKNAKKMSVQL
jgi:oxygen-dependent protoporphyrinogen oxidase